MELIRNCIVGEIGGFIAAIAICVVFQLLTGRISTHYLFFGRTSSGAIYFSPERVQLLLATLTGAGYYFGSVVTQHPMTSFPPVPESLLGIMGTSHAVYLAGKSVARFR